MIATLFDFDGVLVDSEPVHLAAFNDVLVDHGITISDEEYAARYISLDDAGVMRAALVHAGRAPTDAEVRALVDAKAPRFMARFESAFRIFPGAADLVQRRAARGPVGVVSGALEHEIRYALGKMQLTGAVGFVVSAEHTAAGKPDPAPFLLAVETLRARGHAGGAVVLEDSTGGVTAAKRAGLRCVAVTHSTSRQALVDAGADAVVADLAAVTDALLEETA